MVAGWAAAHVLLQELVQAGWQADGDWVAEQADMHDDWHCGSHCEDWATLA